MEENKEFDGKGLMRDLIKRAWIIVLCAAVFACGSLVFTKKFVKPTYKASVTFYVNNNNTSTETGSNPVQSQNLAVALQLAKSYVVAIQKETVLERVRQLGGLSITGAEIRGMISAEVVEETEIFQVNVICGDRQLTYEIAKALEDHAPTVIKEIIGGSQAEVVDEARIPKGKYAPNYTTSTILGGLAGGVLATLVLVIFLLTDNRIREEEDMFSICQIPVLGTIPDFSACARQQEQAKDKKRKERRRA